MHATPVTILNWASKELSWRNKETHADLNDDQTCTQSSDWITLQQASFNAFNRAQLPRDSHQAPCNLLLVVSDHLLQLHVAFFQLAMPFREFPALIWEPAARNNLSGGSNCMKHTQVCVVPTVSCSLFNKKELFKFSVLAKEYNRRTLPILPLY